MAVNPVKLGKLGLMGDSAGPADQMPPEFALSMAAAIERAFDRLRQAEGMPALALNDNTGTTRDRRMLFVAIAQGIFQYLDAIQADPVQVQASGNVVSVVPVQFTDPMDVS